MPMTVRREYAPLTSTRLVQTVSRPSPMRRNRVDHGREAGAIRPLTGSFNHAVDQPVVSVYGKFQPES